MKRMSEVFILMGGNENPWEYPIKVFSTESAAKEYENYLNRVFERGWTDTCLSSDEIEILGGFSYCYVAQFDLLANAEGK